MSLRSKKDDEWDERVIGFEELDENYSNIFLLIIADYHPFYNVVRCMFKNAK